MIRVLVRSIMLGLFVVMAAATFYAATHTIDVSPIDSRDAIERPSTADAARTVELAPLAALPHTRDRPLFQADRRPLARVAEVGTAVPATGLTLIGLMGTSDNSRKALIRLEGQNRAMWVGVGGVAGDSTIREIGSSSVILERDRKRVELRIRPPHRGG